MNRLPALALVFVSAVYAHSAPDAAPLTDAAIDGLLISTGKMIRYPESCDLTRQGRVAAAPLMTLEGINETRISAAEWVCQNDLNRRIFYSVTVLGWRAVAKEDERFMVSLLKPANYVSSPARFYVSFDVYLQIQNKKAAVLSSLGGRIADQLAKGLQQD